MITGHFTRSDILIMLTVAIFYVCNLHETILIQEISLEQVTLMFSMMNNALSGDNNNNSNNSKKKLG